MTYCLLFVSVILLNLTNLSYCRHLIQTFNSHVDHCELLYAIQCLPNRLLCAFNWISTSDDLDFSINNSFTVSAQLHTVLFIGSVTAYLQRYNGSGALR